MSRRAYRKKRYLLPALLILLLVAFRISLPYIVERYVNGVLADIPGYYGEVRDIDISLIRGAYEIEDLYLNKVNADSEVPYISIPHSDISIDWGTLLKGEVVSEIILTEPTYIYVAEDQEKGGEEPEIEDWTKVLTDLVPIEINTLQIRNGKLAFVELSPEPNIDLDMHQVHLQATNLRNVIQKDRTLPSTVHATAVSTGAGKVTLEGKMNLVKQIPDMDLSFALENATVTALNDYTNHYAGIDFAEGIFHLYSEIAISDGYLTGYIKPMIVDSKLIEKEDKFFEKIWEGFVGFFKFVLKNHKTDTLATRVPIEGDLREVKSKLLPTILNIFKNAWISAFKGVVDGDVDFQDAKEGADKQKE